MNNRHIKHGLVPLLSLLLAAASWAQSPPSPPPGMAGMGGDPGMGAEEAVEENPPAIDSVTYSGNTKISTAEIKKGSVITLGQKVSKPLVRAELDRVTALYKARGLDVSVSPDIAHPADGHVTITVLINESGKGGDGGPAAGGPAGAPPAGAPARP